MVFIFSFEAKQRQEAAAFLGHVIPTCIYVELWQQRRREDASAPVLQSCVCFGNKEKGDQGQKVAVALTTCGCSVCDRMRPLHRLGVSVQMQPGRDDLEPRLPVGQFPPPVLPAVQTSTGEFPQHSALVALETQAVPVIHHPGILAPSPGNPV